MADPQNRDRLITRTTYWLVVDVTEASWFGSSYADVTNLDGWSIPAVNTAGYFSNLPDSWTPHDGSPQIFSIEASAIPEPANYAGLLGLATLPLIPLRQRRVRVRRSEKRPPITG